MSQPYDAQCEAPALREIDEDKGEFWVPNPWQFPDTGENLSAFERNGVHLNAGDGTFFDISYLSGADDPGDARSVTSFDITGDGMEELFVRQVGGGPLLVYENQFPKTSWLRVLLKGDKSNRLGIGSKLVCEVDGRKLCRELYPVVNFLSQSPAQVHFGLADAEQIDRLTIQWPSGETTELTDVPINAAIEIDEATGKWTEITPGQPRQ